ncbi:MAG: hypothetical protein PF484_10160 [Bacteroidales bacterium]|jgi:hypothetical protein|nr:hypothetical protein [Bacteroidales bacterium]
MWEYEIIIRHFEDPNDYELTKEMDKFGAERWEIFSIKERVVENWNTYGEPHNIVEYKLYMKRIIQEN